MSTTLAAPPRRTPATANDRLKERFNTRYWQSLLVAAMLHLAILFWWPALSVADLSISPQEGVVLDILHEVAIPPPPDPIERPAVPQLSTTLDISEEITIAPSIWDRTSAGDLPAPPTALGTRISESPTFTPYEVKPELRNRAEFARLLERSYPPTLRDAGIGGTVVLWVFIDESGAVQNTRVTQSSGQEPLDQIAEQIMREARFTPALNRDQRVAVWIQLPVTFQAR